MLRQTYTYVVMEVSEATYREIAEKLVKAQYEHCFASGVGSEMDMTGIALALEKKPLFYRASQYALCEACGKSYGEHPMDRDLVAYDGQPYVHILCNGDRVKL